MGFIVVPGKPAYKTLLDLPSLATGPGLCQSLILLPYSAQYAAVIVLTISVSVQLGTIFSAMVNWWGLNS